MNTFVVHGSTSRELRVLLVDDDGSLCRAFVRTIRLAGYDVAGYPSVEAIGRAVDRRQDGANS